MQQSTKLFTVQIEVENDLVNISFHKLQVGLKIAKLIGQHYSTKQQQTNIDQQEYISRLSYNDIQQSLFQDKQMLSSDFRLQVKQDEHVRILSMQQFEHETQLPKVTIQQPQKQLVERYEQPYQPTKVPPKTISDINVPQTTNVQQTIQKAPVQNNLQSTIQQYITAGLKDPEELKKAAKALGIQDYQNPDQKERVIKKTIHNLLSMQPPQMKAKLEEYKFINSIQKALIDKFLQRPKQDQHLQQATQEVPKLIIKDQKSDDDSAKLVQAQQILDKLQSDQISLLIRGESVEQQIKKAKEYQLDRVIYDQQNKLAQTVIFYNQHVDQHRQSMERNAIVKYHKDFTAAENVVILCRVRQQLTKSSIYNWQNVEQQQLNKQSIKLYDMLQNVVNQSKNQIANIQQQELALKQQKYKELVAKIEYNDLLNVCLIVIGLGNQCKNEDFNAKVLLTWTEQLHKNVRFTISLTDLQLLIQILQQNFTNLIKKKEDSSLKPIRFKVTADMALQSFASFKEKYLIQIKELSQRNYKNVDMQCVYLSQTEIKQLIQTNGQCVQQVIQTLGFVNAEEEIQIKQQIKQNQEDSD